MNHTVTAQSHLAPLLPSLQCLVAARNGPANCDRFELEDTVLRAGGFAWDIGSEAAAPLHAEIARLTEEKEAADAAAAAEAAISDETLKARIAMRRWEQESSGCEVTLGELPAFRIKTDPESQSKLTGLLVVSSAQPVAVSWKDADGAFHAITNADVPVMVAAVFGHVQACFDREAALLETLAATASEDRPAFIAVIDQFWPK